MQPTTVPSRVNGFPILGRVDGFNQDKGAGERDEGSEILCRLLAAQGDALEALELTDPLLGPSPPLVEDRGEEFGLGGGILAVWDGGADAASAGRRSLPGAARHFGCALEWPPDTAGPDTRRHETSRLLLHETGPRSAAQVVDRDHPTFTGRLDCPTLLLDGGPREQA